MTDQTPSGGWLQYQEYVLRELIDLNNQLKEIRTDLHGDNRDTGIFNRLTAIERHMKAQDEDKKGRTAVLVALISSVGALIIGLAPYLPTLFR